MTRERPVRFYEGLRLKRRGLLTVLIAALNMWLGVARAGYSAAEELPIFLLIFVPLAAIAILLRRLAVRAGTAGLARSLFCYS